MNNATADIHYRTSFSSPLGELTLVATDKGLRSIEWEESDDTKSRGPDAMPAWKEIRPAPNHPVLVAAVQQLGEYFDSKRGDFDLPLDLRGTEFQLLAWQALATIPAQETITYGEQARRIGRPNAFRAVGAANGRNPVPIVLPCHRVVGSSGALVGYSGSGGTDTKQFLLDHEARLDLKSDLCCDYDCDLEGA